MGHFNSFKQVRKNGNGNGHHNGNGNGYNGLKPVIIFPFRDDAEARYDAAFDLVQHIDATLSAGTQHYYTKSGQLLRTLDEVVHAILADNLVWDTQADVWDQGLARAA